jgi:hypothetical protein
MYLSKKVIAQTLEELDAQIAHERSYGDLYNGKSHLSRLERFHDTLLDGIPAVKLKIWIMWNLKRTRWCPSLQKLHAFCISLPQKDYILSSWHRLDHQYPQSYYILLRTYAYMYHLTFDGATITPMPRNWNNEHNLKGVKNDNP